MTEPHTFKDDLESLIEDAETNGLHPNHVDNILEAVMEEREIHVNGRSQSST